MAVNKVFNVFVTHVLDTLDCVDKPNFCNMIFWGQKDRQTVAQLEEDITACAFHSRPIPTFSDLMKEKLCCVFIDSSWLRCSISDLKLDDMGMLEVFCIDYGIMQSVPLKFLRLIPPNANFIRTCRPLAFKFLFADVVIPKGKREKEPILQFLLSFIRFRTVTLLSLGVYGDLEGVRVYLHGELLAKQLVEKRLVVAAETYTTALQSRLPAQPSPTKMSTPPKAQNALLTNDLGQIKAIPDARRSRKISDSTGSIENNVHVYFASSLAPDVKQSVIVTNVQNGPERFTVQVSSPVTEQTLTMISKKLSAYANRTLKKLENPIRGTPCIAISSRDKLFHRGLVTSVDDSKYLSIYFVDHGYTELINVDSLFHISTELMSFELQAVRVTLADAAELMALDGMSELFIRTVLFKKFDCMVTDSTIRQTVALFDESGRSVKDILLAMVPTTSIQSPIVQLLKLQNGSPALSRRLSFDRVDIKVPPATVDLEEKLFVTYTGTPGYFFGQFEKRPESDLKALTEELVSVYRGTLNDLISPKVPLLYADLESHVGDYGIIRWSADGHMYRIKIMEESGVDVKVIFIDYGNVIKVHRKEVLAPVKSLTHFDQEPFGVSCFVSGVKLNPKEWDEFISEKSVRVRLGPASNDIHPAIFQSDVLHLITDTSTPMSSVLSPDAKPWTPKSVKEPTGNGPKPFALKSNHQLFDDDYEESVPSPIGFKDMETEAELLIDIDSTPSNNLLKEANVIHHAERPSSRTSTSSRGVEDRLAAKRLLPIAQPMQLFYPEQEGLEGQTKELEVVYVENPSSFFCQLAEKIDPLNELMTKLSVTYADETKPCLADPKVGAACVAKYVDDGGWYRGQILQINGDDIEVLFVDYGNKQRSPISLAKVIDEEFAALPAQGYHCSLKGVADKNEWNAEDVKRFEQVAMERRLIATFSPHREDDKFPVCLCAKKADGSSITINDLFRAPPVTKIPIPSEDYEHLPVEATASNVNIAWFCDVERFFLSPVDFSPYQEKLDRLEKFYSALSPDELVEDEPSEGLACVVKFNDDGHYYRSKIITIEDDIAEVLFVDYGNMQTTPLKELKRIHPDFMGFPQLTWQCKLKGVKPVVDATAEHKQHIEACFTIGEIVSALLTRENSVVYSAILSLPQLGDVTSYLIKHEVVVGEDIQVTPQNMNFVLDESLSVHAIIPFVKSPAEFWIQPEPQSVESLMERIDIMTAEPDFLQQPTFQPSIGKYCLAFFAEDGRWYRAVINAVSTDTSTVYYIDYGNTEVVKNSDLRSLPDTLASLPAMAFKCTLEGGASYTKEVNEKFQQLAIDIVVAVQFIRVIDNVMHVRLVNPDGVDLADMIGLTSISSSKVEEIELDAYVAYTTSPGQFWIQRKQEEATLSAIQDKLMQLDGPNRESLRLRERPVVGQLYAVYHADYSAWYRAEITSLDTTSAKVRFVDYGDTHPVSFSDFCHLPDELRSIPPMAVQCRLNLPMAGAEWSDEACKSFSSACPPHVVCRVVLGRMSDNIQLIDSMRTPTEDIFELLAPLLKAPLGHNHLEKVLDLIETITEKTIEEAPPIIRSSTEWIKDAVPGQLLTSKGSCYCVPSPLYVWIQLDPELVDAVTDDVQSFVSSPDFNQRTLQKPFVGCSCLALFPEDGHWYRARIESIDSAGSILVNYVDYGNTCQVQLEHLRVLPHSLVNHPAMALRCILNGADPDSSSFPSSEECQDVIFNQALSVTLIDKRLDHAVVELRDSIGNDLNAKLGFVDSHQDVTQELVISTEKEVIPGAVEVRVSFAKSADMFWIQRQSDEQVIDQIRDNLRPFDGDSTDKIIIDLKEDELYAVMHPEYNRFYRGRVNQMVGDAVEVFFLDFGQTCWAPKTNFRACPAILKYIPPMAIQCSFRTPIHQDPNSEEVRKAFREIIEGVDCQAVCDGFQPVQGSWTLETLYAKGVNVASILSNMVPSSRDTLSRNQDGFDVSPAMFTVRRQRGL